MVVSGGRKNKQKGFFYVLGESDKFSVAAGDIFCNDILEARRVDIYGDCAVFAGDGGV